MATADSLQAKNIDALLLVPGYAASLSENEIREQFGRFQELISGKVECEGLSCGRCGYFQNVHVEVRCPVCFGPLHAAMALVPEHFG